MVLAGLVPSEVGRKSLLEASSHWWFAGNLEHFWLVEVSPSAPQSLFLACICDHISPSYKDTSHTGFGHTHNAFIQTQSPL